MNVESISGLWNLFVVKGIGAAAFFLLLGNIFIWYRTGSAHLLLKSLWGRLIGGKSDKPKELRDFLDEYTGLLEFRFRTGLKKVRTISHAKSVLLWIKTQDEDIGALAACRGYFDIEKICLRDPLPKAWVLVVQWLFVIFLAISTVMIGALGVQNSALIKLKDSEHWILLGKDRAKPFSAAGFQYSSCESKIEDLTKAAGMPAKEIRAICEEVTTSPANLTKFIDENVWGQRIVFGYFAGLSGLLFFSVLGSSRALAAAIAMKKRLSDRKASVTP